MNKVRGQVVLNPAERLMSLSMPEPNSGCWIWLGATRGPSPEIQYGRLTIGSRSDGSRRTVSAHRYSFEVFRDAIIPDGAEVCHRCDNPYCINPDHLWLGTKAENMEDRQRKGRNMIASGERNGHARLTLQAVEEIRSSSERRSVLAERYGVHPKTIQKAKNGKYWPAAPQPEGE